MLSSLFFDARLAGDGEFRFCWAVGKQGGCSEADVRPAMVKETSERGRRANKRLVSEEMFAQREPKRSLEAGMGKQVSDFREDVRSRERNPGSAGGVWANKHPILEKMFAQEREARPRWRLVGEQGAHFEFDVCPEEAKKASERWSGQIA